MHSAGLMKGAGLTDRFSEIGSSGALSGFEPEACGRQTSLRVIVLTLILQSVGSPRPQGFLKA